MMLSVANSDITGDPGNSVPSEYPKQGQISSALSSESIKHRPEETTGDLIESGWIAKYGESSPEEPLSTPERTQTSKEPDGLTFSEIRKLLKSRTLDPRQLSKKVARLMKSRPHLSANFDNKRCQLPQASTEPILS
ncbi:hypothetical protein OS493_034763 [Desmophyllum pertusum]|uniref:Uncharacterized protein n=1 Tax=Desmophyllum pertusum TaxID=174260 RepID=A0A9W9YV98_9CNID|nr:hypothetical protein OS493_034763 [Desmophyllum pertusum]